MVATPVLLLAQVPPVTALASEVVALAHNVVVPVTGPGVGLTVITVEAEATPQILEIE
jgi:hypothetical protein